MSSRASPPTAGQKRSLSPGSDDRDVTCNGNGRRVDLKREATRRRPRPISMSLPLMNHGHASPSRSGPPTKPMDKDRPHHTRSASPVRQKHKNVLHQAGGTPPGVGPIAKGTLSPSSSNGREGGSLEELVGQPHPTVLHHFDVRDRPKPQSVLSVLTRLTVGRACLGQRSSAEGSRGWNGTSGASMGQISTRQTTPAAGMANGGRAHTRDDTHGDHERTMGPNKTTPCGGRGHEGAD
ncbi:uncharacterized protein C8Q71DRAFT_728179 [Rhodofomes roseus]|uniref:Uncharacterized protein n=1 Tax=Rhodofomes roseus TaxID=34475 RepID=A0ABQ8JZP5_9APHY|nr:uncharacterized protein C8Q71DRAFT_728179 [Rhodofomes roseus]KAH9829309.1 hypothetical protein C8Q71DRAFT_728179 [Rhodofomes roseus]